MMNVPAKQMAPAMAPKQGMAQPMPAMGPAVSGGQPMVMEKPMQANAAPEMKAPMADMQSASMAQSQVKAMGPQIPNGAVGVGNFKSQYAQGKMDSNRKFSAMQNLVGGRYRF